MRVQYTLKIEEPQKDVRILNFMSQEVVVGRGEGAIPLQDPQISTRHVVISTKNHQLFVRDLQSTNGTKLNGKALVPQTPAEIRTGDVLLLGKSSRITCLSIDVVRPHAHEQAKPKTGQARKVSLPPPPPKKEEVDSFGLPIPREPEPIPESEE